MAQAIFILWFLCKEPRVRQKEKKKTFLWSGWLCVPWRRRSRWTLDSGSSCAPLCQISSSCREEWKPSRRGRRCHLNPWKPGRHTEGCPRLAEQHKSIKDERTFQSFSIFFAIQLSFIQVSERTVCSELYCTCRQFQLKALCRPGQLKRESALHTVARLWAFGRSLRMRTPPKNNSAEISGLFLTGRKALTQTFCLKLHFLL